MNLFKLFNAFISGLIFGFGLLVSDMVNPQNIIHFMDIFGQWNPSIIFVMLGAISIAVITFSLVKIRHKTLLNEPINLPHGRKIDKRLIFGSITFGLGWGLVGYCPGPALASILFGKWETILFVLSMLLGMYVFNRTQD
jgi:uncharacterized protein